MSIIDALELSVRASNVLRKMGVETMDDFMALTRQTVMGQKNAGRRTWNEVSEIQTYYRHQALEQAQETTDTDDLRERAALAALPGVIHACRHDTRRFGETMEQMFARKAWAIADAMCAARTKVEGETE